MTKARLMFIAAMSTLVIAGSLWAIWGSPWLRVRSVTVTVLADTTSSWRDATLQGRVRAALPDVTDHPLVTVDGADIAQRLVKIRGVADAEVRRGWPNTMAVLVRPRIPVAVFAATRSGVPVWQLVDQHCVVVEERTTAPAGWVVLSVSPATSGGKAAMQVWARLPKRVQTKVVAMSAKNPQSDASVEFTLRSGARVVWGDVSNSDRKVEVLQALLRYPARIYDVSAPDVPTTTK